MLITPEYRALNAQLHESGHYGISGHKWASDVCAAAARTNAQTVLDYGCGQGTLGMAFAHGGVTLPFTFREYDPAILGKDERPEPADLVVCGDVLEHIEPDCLDEVLDDLRGLARKAVFLVISTRPAGKFLADGRNAHLIVERPFWWLPKLMDRWDLVSFENRGAEFTAIGKSR